MIETSVMKELSLRVSLFKFVWFRVTHFWPMFPFYAPWKVKWEHKIMLLKLSILYAIIALKLSKYGVFSGPYLLAFGLNKKRYGVSLRIRSKYGKLRTRKSSVCGHLSHSEFYFKSSLPQSICISCLLRLLRISYLVVKVPSFQNRSSDFQCWVVSMR